MKSSRKIVLAYVAKRLEPTDERIGLFLKDIEEVSRTQINRFVSHSSYLPKEIAGDRVEFVSQWLREPNEYGVPATLTNGLTGCAMLLVTIKNVPSIAKVSATSTVSFLEVEIDEVVGLLSEFASVFEKLSSDLEAYWGVLRSPALMAQLRRCKSMYSEALKLATHPKQVELIKNRRHEYVYDVSPRTFRGVGPAGIKFDAYLDWTNFWGGAMATAMKFPQPELDGPLDGLYNKVGETGWIVRLTEEPTDLDRSEHLAQFQWAYERFKL